MSVTAQRSAILRAEILRGESAEITCALEMTGESVFIVTEGLPSIGEVVNLRLSFPRTVRPLLVSGRVRQVRLSSGPGSPPGFVADFDIDSEDIKQKLVEGNQLIRDMFAYAVERYFSQRAGKVRLAQAASVAAAWKHLDETKSYDLAVVDQMLPDETGSSLIAALRRNGTFRRMPIVGMSVGSSDVRKAMLEAGADLFLQKPIVLKDLFCTIEFLMMDVPGRERGAA